MERIAVVLMSAACMGLVLCRRSMRKRAGLLTRVEALDTALAEARLLEHRTRINPHMLMNTLNSMSVLAEEEGAVKVREATSRLAALMRVALEQASPLTTLRAEIDLVERYLAVERVRFGDRLSVRSHITPVCLDALVPAFLLQPIVENAVRHGRTPRSGDIDVTITARHDHDRLQLSVADRGAGLGAARRNGFGLGSTRRHLELLFHDAWSLDITANGEAGVTVTVSLPFRLEGSHAHQNAAG